MIAKSPSLVTVLHACKKHYGKVGEKVIEKALLEAMGIKVEWEKKEFKF